MDNHLTITLPSEFDFQVNLNHLKNQHDTCLYEIKNESIIRLINTTKGYVLTQINSQNNHELIITILHPQKISTEQKNEILNFITHWFDLKRDLVPFYQLASEDKILASVVHTHYGLRHIGIPDLFEALCSAILSQQINLKFAAQLKCDFIKSFGDSITYNDTKFWSFPSYEKIATLSNEHMAHIKTTDRKKECIINIAKKMANKTITAGKLIELNDPELIVKELTKVKGIGPWTAEYILMRSLRYPSIFPVNDVGLLNAIQHIENLNERPNKQDVLTLFNRWKTWESYAAFYLWKTLY